MLLLPESGPARANLQSACRGVSSVNKVQAGLPREGPATDAWNEALESTWVRRGGLARFMLVFWGGDCSVRTEASMTGKGNSTEAGGSLGAGFGISKLGSEGGG